MYKMPAMIVTPAHEAPIPMPALAPALRPEWQLEPFEQLVDDGSWDAVTVMTEAIVLDGLVDVEGSDAGTAEELEIEEIEELETALSFSGGSSSNVSLLGFKQSFPGPQQAHKLDVWLYTMSGASLSSIT